MSEDEEATALPEAIADRAPLNVEASALLGAVPNQRASGSTGSLPRDRPLSGNVYLGPAELASALENPTSPQASLALDTNVSHRLSSSGPESLPTLAPDPRRRSESTPLIATERGIRRESFSSSVEITDSGEDDENIEDGDDDDDVEFWGGVSPRERAAEEERMRDGSERSPIRFWHSMMSGDEDEDEDEDEEDDSNDDNDDYDDDSMIDDEDDDGAEEIFMLAGHH